MQGEFHIVNSEHTWKCWVKDARAYYDKYKYVTFVPPRIGPLRSLDQNALFHVWATEVAAHAMRKDKKCVSHGELDGCKRALKRKFWLETKHKWMIYEIIDPLTGESKKDLSSSTRWSRGEMFEFLTWLQAYAATDLSLILESQGEFLRRQQQNES